MTTRQLISLIKKNEKLKEERHPAFKTNRFLKVFIYLTIAYYAACMMLMGVMLPLAFREIFHGVASFHIFSGYFLFVVFVDFWMRFTMQETPAQQGTHYALLPIRRSLLMHLFLTRAGLSMGNLFWGFFLVPFGAIAVLPLLGWTGYICWLVGFWLIFIANGYAYQFCRALCLKNLLWTLLPISIQLAYILLFFIPAQHFLDRFSTLFIYNISLGHIWPFAAILAVIAILYAINYRLQYRMVYNDVAKKEDVRVSRSSQMNFLNHFGILGEYLKLEVKLRLRNSQVRTQFFVGLGAMCFISALLYFTDVYDEMPFMKSFICLYDYIVLGLITLVTVMGYEGNYLDGLMSRKESIKALLMAKYYFNSFLLLIPICILIPLIIAGKISLMMNLGYLSFTIGCLYPIIFQLAVYNQNTLPLNKKITAKQNSTIQITACLTMMFAPIGVEKLATVLFGDPWGYVALIVMGIIGVAAHRLWIGNIYNRFMARRYRNMEGFRASKSQ